MSCERRVVFYLETDDFDLLKDRAGLVPVSAWARAVLLERLHGKAEVVQPRSVADIETRLPAGGAVLERAASKPILTKCPHRKQKGELCYKCDQKWGFPCLIE